jgi:predicted Zn-dependent protease
MRRTGGLFTLLAAAQLAGCSFGGDGPVVSQSDREYGTEQHPQLLAEFGGAYKGDEAEYLRAFGNRVAATADLDGQCTFTLVNSDVANAFAVPGCFIYVTRGLMGIVNSEAELGAVLAHEVGHIVARHSQRQQRRSLWRTLGVVAVQVLTGSEQLSQIAGAAAGYFTLRYSRKQEYEADDLGLRYLRELGYDPFAATDMLSALGRHEQFVVRTRGREEARSIPEWARTHPLTDNRIARASEAAAAMGVQRGELPEKEAAFLATVDGMLYGDDPQQGFVTGRAFAHPVMRIAFEAPQGFSLTNSPQAILIEGPDGMRGEFAGGPMPQGGLEAYTAAMLRQLLKGAQVSADAGRRTRINGLDALVTNARVQSGQERVALTLAAYAAGEQAYHFLMLSTSGAAAPARLDQLFASFRLISEAEARSLRPRRIDARRASGGDTIATLAAQMAGDNKVEHFLMLNGRSADQPVRPGELVKLVVFGPTD